MIRSRVSALALSAPLLIACCSSVSARPEGHGGGAGHVAAAPRFVGPCRYGPRYRGYYAYPGCYGLGIGIGVGGYYGYPYGPYGPYGPPAYVYPAYGLPPDGYPFAGPAGAPGAPPQPPQPPVLTDADVALSIRVPPDAVVRINGQQTAQAGPRREFMASGLSAGRTYTFSVSAHWTAPDGTDVGLERRVSVQGGERRTIDFLMPAPPRD
jgi:uncharacterized protein (TIGR03000 family)